jgi:hypothetical protein
MLCKGDNVSNKMDTTLLSSSVIVKLSNIYNKIPIYDTLRIHKFYVEINTDVLFNYMYYINM